MKRRSPKPLRIRHPFLVICAPGIALVAVLAVMTPTHVHPDFTSKAAISLAGSGGAYQRIRWSTLVPAQWDPSTLFKDQDIASWGDTDPRALTLQRRMQAAWNDAPVNATLDGHALRIAGYVVPIDESWAGMREFLLVPYFGACIHIPPPPANQIIDVSVARPVQGVHSMDAVWVSGVMSVNHTHHEIGDSAYAMRADAVDLYTGPAQ